MNLEERKKLVLENLPLVGYSVAAVCAKASHLCREDLAALGTTALVASSQSFDPDLGIPFGAYVRRRILAAMADHVRASDWATRRARNRTTLELQETLAGDLGRQPTVGELATVLCVTRPQVNTALADPSRSVTTLREGTAGLIAEGLTPEESALAAENRLMLRGAVRDLPEKIRYDVEQIYFEDRSVAHLSDELQITHTAVSQHRAEVVRLLNRAGVHSSVDGRR